MSAIVNNSKHVFMFELIKFNLINSLTRSTPNFFLLYPNFLSSLLFRSRKRKLRGRITTKFILQYMLSGLNLCGATLPKYIQRYIKKLCAITFYIIHTKLAENWLNRGQNIQTIDVYKLKYLYQMQNLLKSTHLQIVQPFPNSN